MATSEKVEPSPVWNTEDGSSPEHEVIMSEAQHIVRTLDENKKARIRRQWKLAVRRENTRQWTSRNRKRKLAYLKEWREKNRDRRNAYRAARQHQIDLTSYDLDSVAAYYRYVREAEEVTCYLCGKLILLGQRTVDHVNPLAMNGTHTLDNLAPACGPCNARKCASPPPVGYRQQITEEELRVWTVNRVKYRIWFHAIHAPDGTEPKASNAIFSEHGVDPMKLRQVVDGEREQWQGWSINRLVHWSELLPPIPPTPHSKPSQAEIKKRHRSTLVALTHNGTAFLPLNDGRYALVDAEDWPRCRQHNWHTQFKGYWRAKASFSDGKTALLTRFIANNISGPVRPLNGNHLDCRNCNLRQIVG